MAEDEEPKRKRFTDSSVDVSHYARLFDETLHSSAEICLYDHPSVQAIRASHPPRCRVFMTRLEPKLQVYADEQLTRPVACSDEVDERQIGEAVPQAVAEAYIFDCSSVGQIMCVGVGRYPHNQLRPFVGDDVERYYEDPDVLDPACVCGQISRDHGLVFLDADGSIKFRDFGTKKNGARGGSKNGTWINGEYRVQNAVFNWREGDYLGLGGRAWVRREGQLVKEHVFKLRYERLPDVPAPSSS